MYIGETARTTHPRGKEKEAHSRHRRDHPSAVAAHAVEENHEIHWQPRVIGKEQNTTKRRVNEAILVGQIRRKEKKHEPR